MSHNLLMSKISSLLIEWCGETSLRPYGLTHQASFQQWLAQRGFLGPHTLQYKVFYRRKYHVR